MDHVLSEGLAATDPQVQCKAIEEAAQWGQEWALKIAPLTKAPQEDVRQAAVEGLCQTGSKAPEVVRYLTETLENQSEDRFIRQKAAEGLGEVGATSDEDTIKVLKKAMGEDEDPPVRFYAARSLLKLSGISEGTLLALFEAYATESPLLRKEMVETLGELGVIAVSFLVKATCDSDSRVRCSAVDALARLARESSPEAIAALSDATRDEEAMVRRSAIAGLAPLGLRDPRYIAIFCKGLRDTALSVRQASVQALKTLGPDARDALQELTDALRDNVTIRCDAAMVLQTLGAAAWNAVPALVGALQDGPDDSPTEDQVDVVIRQRQIAKARHQIVHALRNILYESGQLPAVVKQALKSEAPEVRIAVVEVLAGVGPLGWDAMSELLAALQDEADPGVRAKVVSALRAICSAGGRELDGRATALDDKVAEALEKALSDPHGEVRRAAQEAPQAHD